MATKSEKRAYILKLKQEQEKKKATIVKPKPVKEKTE